MRQPGSSSAHSIIKHEPKNCSDKSKDSPSKPSKACSSILNSAPISPLAPFVDETSMTDKQIISVCQTPLHFLFTLSILNCIKSEKKPIIIWIKESLIDQDFINTITQHLEATLVCLKGAERGAATTTVNRIHNLRTIKSLEALNKVTDLYFFNDLSPEVQLIAKISKKNGGNANLVEDGVAIYDIGGVFKRNYFKLLLGKLAYGWWWEKPQRIGETRLHDAIHAINPGQVRKNISNGAALKKLTIDANILSKLFPYDQTIPNSIVFLLPFIGSPASVHEIDRVLKIHLHNFREKVYLKFHPQEKQATRDSLLSLPGYSGYEILRSDLPIEVLFLRSPGKRTVVGSRTSALHVLKSFCPSVAPKYLPEEMDENWIAFYKEMNVEKYKNS